MDFSYKISLTKKCKAVTDFYFKKCFFCQIVIYPTIYFTFVAISEIRY